MDQTFRAIIEVVNRAAAPLRAINMQIAGLVAPITAVKIASLELAEVTGITALGEQATVAMHKVSHLGREIGALAGPIALIGGIASAEGLLEISKKTSEFGEALVHSSEKTGADIPVLARLHYVAKLEDVDPAMLDKGLAKLNSNLFKALHGKNKDFAVMMAKFEGPNWAKKIKGPEEAFAAISAAYGKYTSAVTRAGIVTTGFGDKLGVGLKPILGKSAEEIKALGDEFERMFGKWTPERAKLAQETADNWKRLTAAGEGLAMTIGSAVTPAITEMIVPLREWIISNKELIGAKVNETIKNIGTTLKTIDWQGIGSGIRFVWSGFKGLADVLGTKGLIIAGAAVMFGPIAKSAIEAAWAVTKLGFALAGSILQLELFGATEAGMAIKTALFKTGMAAAAIGAAGLGDALVGLSAIIEATPVGLIVAGTVALGLAAYEIYEHWKPIAAFFSSIWEKIKAVWAPVKQWFSDLWGGIVIELKGIWHTLKPILDAISNFWHRMDSRKNDRRTSAEKDHDARNTPARKALATANRAAFNKGLANTLAFTGAIMLQMPVVAQAHEAVQGIQHVHDLGKEDREARAGLERGFSTPAAVIAQLPKFDIAKTTKVATDGLAHQGSRAEQKIHLANVVDPVRKGEPKVQQAKLIDPSRRSAGPDQAPKGEIDVNVKFDQMPRGTQARAEARGDGLKLKVGKSFAHE